MAVYDAPAERADATEFYTRVTQRLISALSAPTEEGALYEIDTKLRPSGSKGPVAVRLSSFERYYAEEAWTWEMQALTRLRAVAGDAALGARVDFIARAALARPRDEAKTRAEVADMRALMERERTGRSDWDLKLAPGGFVDIEFIAQALQLTHAARAPTVLCANTGEALDELAEVGALSATQHTLLSEAWRLYSDLQQTLRVCVGGVFDPDAAAQPLLRLIAARIGAAQWDAAAAKLHAIQRDVRAAFEAIVGSLPVKPR
jgi:[glutamine synthetase] adenylyltransferase / [glutamine synthetase]-adenylyl-L-tyrosine phosphorylase